MADQDKLLESICLEAARYLKSNVNFNLNLNNQIMVLGADFYDFLNNKKFLKQLNIQNTHIYGFLNYYEYKYNLKNKNKNKKIFIGNLNQWPIDSKSMKIIFMDLRAPVSVSENYSTAAPSDFDCLKTLKQARRVLKSDGKMLILSDHSQLNLRLYLKQSGFKLEKVFHSKSDFHISEILKKPLKSHFNLYFNLYLIKPRKKIKWIGLFNLFFKFLVNKIKWVLEPNSPKPCYRR